MRNNRSLRHYIVSILAVITLFGCSGEPPNEITTPAADQKQEAEEQPTGDQTEAEEEKARWESLTEEERKAELDDLDEFAFAFEFWARQDKGRRKAREKEKKRVEDRLITGTTFFLTDMFVLYLSSHLLSFFSSCILLHISMLDR